MYSMTLEINQKCNLKCKYCYLGEKAGTVMSLETAKKSIDLAFQKAEIHRDRKIWFDFIGGEALLDFELLNQMMSYILEQNKDKRFNLKFSMTSNATVLNQRFMDFLIGNKFDLKISIDGYEEVHDLNRITHNERGSFNKIIKNWDYIADYEMKTGKYVQVTNVVTRNNYMFFYESVKFLVEELGVKIIDTAIDLFVDWTKEELETICSHIYRIYALYERCFNERRAFGWSFVNEVLHSVEEKRKFYSCGAGIISLYVRTDGTFFSCSTHMAQEEGLGDVDRGLNPQKIAYLKQLNSIDNETCLACEIYELCEAKSCIMQSLDTNGDVNIPDPTLCYMQKFKTSFYYDNLRSLKKINEGSYANG
ncbi:4Fe-4S cluster-binding domain-containing protein [Paenibacillus albidus]|nr:4Fe-4S cluster-binding domain-containing protein [Paenibacillus albidus]